MPMTSAPLTLLPVSTTDDRETARRLIGEYMNWISDIAGEQYRLSFDIDAMLRSDLDDATKFYPPHGRFYLVQSRDGAIGVGALKRLAVEVGEIQRMYVQPSARGLGAGRLLVQRLLDDARALGLRRVRLESLKVLAAAHALYRSVGFVEIAPYADSSMQDYQSHTALQRYCASAIFMEIELSYQGRGASAPGAGEPQDHRRHGAAGLKHRNPLTQESS